MKPRIVKFKSPEMAERVQTHFHNVEIVGSELYFAEFDKVAFNFVVNLEKLNFVDYQVINEDEKERNQPWLRRPSSIPDERLILLKINLYLCQIPRSLTTLRIGDNPTILYPTYYEFRLLVHPLFRFSAGHNEIPLIVNQGLIEFANLLQDTIREHATPILTTDRVSHAVCQIDDIANPVDYTLKLEIDSETKLIRFYPSEASLDVNR